MALAALTLLCNQTDVENYLSPMGVKLSVDDDGDGYVSTQEQQAISDALAEAAETVYFYTWHKYTPNALATSNLVNRKATIFAAYRLRGRKGNKVPEQVEEDAAKAEELLATILNGNGLLPMIPLRRILAPVWSYTRVDARYNFRCIRVERNNSSQHNPTTLKQNADWQEAFSFEI